MSERETVIVGAGVSGLSCARALARQGRRPLVLERARGVGGRCATRRVEGQPVDHGVAFLHGSTPAFLAVLRDVSDATPLSPWPRRVDGQGSPCHPDSLRPQEFRLAFQEGVAAFPKHLARGLDVKCEVTVTGVAPHARGWEVSTDRGVIQARTLVLALALEQAVRLLEAPARDLPELAAAVSLLGMFSSTPCLTLLAGYGADTPSPAWDILLPDGAGPLQLISHDSSKRREPAYRVLVAQARGAWSRKHLNDPQEDWGHALLQEMARQVGAWAGRPAWTQFHRWRHARMDLDSRLAQPILLSTPGGGRLGLTGDLFLPGGGIEAAWRSGAELALRLLGEDGDE